MKNKSIAFLARIRGFDDYPKQEKKYFDDEYSYSCFGNKIGKKIYLTPKTFSGKILNKCLMNEDANNKFVYEGTSFDYDKVFQDEMTYEYFF